MLIEHFLRACSPAENLHQRVAGVHLLDVPVQAAGPFPLGGELLLRAPGDEQGHDDRQRHGDQGDQRQQRADPDHERQDADHGQHRGEDLAQTLLERGRHVVDVVGDPAEDVAVGVAVEVLERKSRKLGFDVAAQAVDGALGDPGHDVALRPHQHGRQEVKGDGEEQRHPEGCEIDPPSGRHVHPGQHLSDLSLAVRLQERDGLCLGQAGGQHLADDAVEDDVRRGADDLGPDDRKRHASDAEHGNGADQAELGPQAAEQLAQRLAGMAELGGRRARHAAHPAARLPPLLAGRSWAVDHATASPSCESTISR